MKVTITYIQRTTTTFDMTPEEYCKFRTNFRSRPDIYPENAFNPNLSIDEDSQMELLNFFYKD